LKHLPHLRILHFRLPNLILKEQPENYDVDGFILDAFSRHFDKFASRVFQWLHQRGLCLSLRAVVLGSFAVGEHDTVHRYRAQHCYVKGFQTDITGRAIPVGVQVRITQLRYEEPYAESMAFVFDPEGTWSSAVLGQLVYG
jgi:hypothetical protein